MKTRKEFKKKRSVLRSVNRFAPRKILLNAMDTLAIFHGFGYEAVFMYTNSIGVILIMTMIDLQGGAIFSENNPIRLV